MTNTDIPRRRATGERPATHRQVEFLRTLLQERQPEHVPLLDARLREGLLSFADVSAKINYLKTLPVLKAIPRPATERQVEYVTGLLSERVHDLDADAELTALTYDRASELIDLLKVAVRRSSKAAHGIPAGRYVVPDPAQLGHMLFRRVDTRGRMWIIAGPNEHPSPEGDKALPLIAQDHRFAAAHYGQIIGHCGRCGLRLTDDTSRSIGLGPICRDKDW